MSKETTPIMRECLKEKKYMSPEIINELISMYDGANCFTKTIGQH